MPPFSKFLPTAYQWLLTNGPKIILGIVIFIIGQWVIKLIRRWTKRFFAAQRYNAVRPYLNSLIGMALQVALILVVMQIMGIQMTLFAAVIAAFGVAAGLALAGTLQNFASGALILILKPYKIGDNIITQSQEGTVKAIQLFYTVVTTFDNKTVIVPNSKLSNEIIVKLSREGKRRIDIEMKFSYAIDYAMVKETVIASIDQIENILATPAVRIGITELSGDGYKVMINVWASAHGFRDTTMAVNEKLMTNLKNSGIKLPGL